MKIKYILLILPILIWVGCEDDDAVNVDPIVGTWVVNQAADTQTGSCDGLYLMDLDQPCEIYGIFNADSSGIQVECASVDAHAITWEVSGSGYIITTPDGEATATITGDTLIYMLDRGNNQGCLGMAATMETPDCSACAPCSADGDCESGDTCVNDNCETSCNNGDDCEEGEECSDDGYCEEEPPACFGDCPEYAYPFDAFTPGPASMLFMGVALINGENASEGDIVAAFDQDGTLTGAAEIVVNGGVGYMVFSIYGDDSSTLDDEGIGANDDFYLVLYDASENMTIMYMQAFDCWTNENGATQPGCGDNYLAEWDFTGACGDDQVWCGEAGPTNVPPVADNKAIPVNEDR